MRQQLAIGMDSAFLNKFGNRATKTSQGWNYIVTPDQSLTACEFKQVKHISFKATTERGVALISHGFPFICQFKLSPAGTGDHVVLFAGYSYRKGLSDNIAFAVRDSRFKKLFDTGWSSVCDYASVVVNSDEEALVRSLIRL